MDMLRCEVGAPVTVEMQLQAWIPQLKRSVCLYVHMQHPGKRSASAASGGGDVIHDDHPE